MTLEEDRETLIDVRERDDMPKMIETSRSP
jgi:hypothetical protein